MKNKFQSLGIQLKEIADLLFVPETTLYSWFARQSTIPPEYSGYISGLEIYQQQQNADDLKTMYSKWETSNRTLLETQKTKALQELRVLEQKNNLTLDQIKQKKPDYSSGCIFRNSIQNTFLSICKILKTLFLGAAYCLAGVPLILAIRDWQFKNWKKKKRD
ncbi:MAG: hypothetical protein IPO23_06250 [Flavobacterium sp.]|nr:hypothetical protein [Flavobacterium sp.]